MASYDFGGSDNTVNCVALQPDGKIVVGGGMANGFGLARYQSDGSLDMTFGSGGVVTTPLPGPPGYNVGAVEALALLSDGRIVVAGTSLSNYWYDADFVVARYNVDGSPDATFGDSGLTVTDFFGEYDLAHAVAVQGDGKVVVAGAANRDGGTRSSFAVARYGVDGSLDADFRPGMLRSRVEVKDLSYSSLRKPFNPLFGRFHMYPLARSLGALSMVLLLAASPSFAAVNARPGQKAARPDVSFGPAVNLLAPSGEPLDEFKRLADNPSEVDNFSAAVDVDGDRAVVNLIPFPVLNDRSRRTLRQ